MGLPLRATSLHSGPAPRVATIVALVVVFSAALTTTTGCRSISTLDAERPAAPDAPVASGNLADGTPWSIGPLQPTGSTLDAAAFLRPPGSLATIAIAAGHRSGLDLEERVLADDAGGTVIESHLVHDDGRREYWERMCLREGADGDLFCTSVDTPDEQVLTLFAGDLLFAPAALAPDTPATSASPMETRPTGERIRRTRGRSRRTLELAGESWVEIGDQRHRALVVEVVFIADLNLAQARRESTLYIVPGLGPVAQVWSEVIRILGLFPRETGQTLLLRRVADEPRPAEGDHAADPA